MGVSRAEQVADNASAVNLVLSPDHSRALDAASAVEPRMLHNLRTRAMRRQVVFGADVAGWRG